MTEPNPGIRAEALLAHSAWVRTLAQAVVSRQDQVDDVVQETWRAAIESPPRHATNLAAWLRRVVTNVARQKGRGEARRTRRELDSGAPGTAPSTRELVEEAEGQRRVVSAVLALNEPYRSTVLLRYYRDQTPHEIAQMKGVPAATVRSHLHRALEQLRPALESEGLALHESGGERGAWAGATVLALGWKAKLQIAALAVFVAGVGVWWSARPHGPQISTGTISAAPELDRSPTAEPENDPAAPALSEAREERSRSPISPALSGEPVDSPETSTNVATARIFGRVVDAETGDPLPQATVESGEGELLTDEQGRYRIDSAQVGSRVQLLVRKDGYVSAESLLVVLDDEPIERDVTLVRGAPVTLSVIDVDSGAAVEGAVVRRYDHALELGTTDERGHFTVHVREGQELSLQFTLDGYAEFTWEWQVRDTSLLDRTQIPMRRLGWIDGVVVDEVGEPVRGCALYATSKEPRLRMLPEEDLVHYGLQGLAWSTVPDVADGPVEGAGRFSVPVVPSRAPYHLQVSHDDFVNATDGPIAVDAPDKRVQTRVVLRRGALVRGQVLYNDKPWFRGDVYWVHASGQRGGYETADLEGRYELANVPAGDVRIFARNVSSRTVAESEPLGVRAGSTYDQDLAWSEQTGTIRGSVTDMRGEPVTGQAVTASYHDPKGGYFSFRAETYADGKYELDVVLPHAYRVGVYRKPHRESVERVSAGSENVDFILPDIGTLRLSFVDAETREPVTIERSWLRALSWRVTGTEAFHNIRDPLKLVGSTLDLALPVGSVDLSLFPNHDGYAPKRELGVHVASGVGEPYVIELSRGVGAKLILTGETPLDRTRRSGHLFFLLEQSQIASLRGPFPNQGPPSNNRINGICMWVEEPGLLDQMPEFDATGIAILDGLAPGTYELKCYPDDYVFEPATFELREGRTEIELTWRTR